MIFQDEQESTRRSTIAGAAYNLTNSIVGSGVIGKNLFYGISLAQKYFSLGMSYAFRQSGYLAGFLLLILVAFLTGTNIGYSKNALTRIFEIKIIKLLNDIFFLARLFSYYFDSIWSDGQSHNVPRFGSSCLRTTRFSLAFISSISLSIYLFDILQYYHR